MESTETGSNAPPKMGCIIFFYCIAVVFGLVAWLGMGNSHGLKALFSKDLVYTTGTVVRIDGSSAGTSRFATPIIEYSANGLVSRFRGVGSNLGGFSVGSKVPIAYSRSNPEIVYIRTFGQLYMLPMLMLLFALPFIVIAVAATRKRMKWSGS